MTMLIEILLTIKAWRKGWKGYALLPVAIGTSVSFLIGLAAGASGRSIEDIQPLCVLIELMAIISMIVIAVLDPKILKSHAKQAGPNCPRKRLHSCRVV